MEIRTSTTIHTHHARKFGGTHRKSLPPRERSTPKLNKLEIFRFAIFIVCLFVLNFVFRLWATHVQSEKSHRRKSKASLPLSLGSCEYKLVLLDYKQGDEKWEREQGWNQCAVRCGAVRWISGWRKSKSISGICKNNFAKTSQGEKVE